MKTIKKWIPLFTAAAWAIFVGLGAPATSFAQGSGGASMFQSYSKPMAVPDFSLEDLSGKAVNIKDCRGKVILLHFWATW